MKHLMISVYCVGQNDYELLLKILESVRDENIGVELAMHTHFSAVKPHFLPELAPWKEKLSPYYRTFHGPFREIDATSPAGTEAHRIVTEGFEEAFAFYNDFHGNSMVMHTNQDFDQNADRNTLRANVHDTICEVAEAAARRGVHLCVENVGVPSEGNVLFDEDQYISLINSLPASVGSLIDTGHAFLQNWDMERLIRTLGTRIEGYHINNNNGIADSHRPVFEPGCFYNDDDWRRLFTLMEKYSPDAEWILEYAPGPHMSAKLMEKEIRGVLAMVRSISAENT